MPMPLHKPPDELRFYKMIQRAAALERAEMHSVSYLGEQGRGRVWVVQFTNGAVYRLRVEGHKMNCNRVREGV